MVKPNAQQMPICRAKVLEISRQLEEFGKILERAAGIEPASLAWKAKVLPLHNARSTPLDL